MKCTDCGKPVKPVVAIDIDGTLGDYHGHFLTFAATYLGSSQSGWSYDGAQPFKQWFLPQFDVDERTWHDIKLAYRQGAQKRSMPMYMGANELCDGVREMGAELWLTTTRPYLRLDNVDPDTRHWLEFRHITYDGLLYDEKKYEQLAKLVDIARVVAVLDDLPEQVDAASAAFHWKVPILRRTTWNRAVCADTAAQDMSEALYMIGQRINAWKEQHDR